jgi:hypothetical protein
VYLNEMMDLDAKKRLLQTLHEYHGHVGYDTLINAIRRNVIVTGTHLHGSASRKKIMGQL